VALAFQQFQVLQVEIDDAELGHARHDVGLADFTSEDAEAVAVLLRLVPWGNAQTSPKPSCTAWKTSPSFIRATSRPQ
jgi:hypothetical protein